MKLLIDHKLIQGGGRGVAKVTPSEYQKWRQKEKIGNNYKGKKGKKHTGEKLQK